MMETVALPLISGDFTEALSINAFANLIIAVGICYAGCKVLQVLYEDCIARKKYAMQKVSNEAFLDKYVRSYQIALVKKQAETEGLANLEEVMETFPKTDFMDGIKEDLSNKMKNK
jgi:hypothetical protein